jgi:hypothetical protein
MKRIIQSIIASFFALSLVYLPVFAQPYTPVNPHKTTEAGPIIPGIKTISLKKIAPIDAPQLPEQAQVAPIPTPAPQPAPVQAQAQSASTGGCVTGWSSGDYYLDKIVVFESGGRSCATNPGDCFGLLQACPGAPLRAACGGDPGCQIAWFQANKTGGRSWAQVWQHELDYGWW